MNRLKPYFLKGHTEAGCDEAGRGCLAGPVFAAAVILPEDFFHPLMNDSKQLSVKKRELLRTVIEESALAWAVARVNPAEIDEINILNASIKAMHLAIDQLHITPGLLLIDGPRFHPFRDIPHRCEIKGDARFASIAAASILAKTYRDAFMKQLHLTYPDYHWDQNKGYPTRSHRQAIMKLGITPWHRKTFKLLDPQMKLEFRNL